MTGSQTQVRFSYLVLLLLLTALVAGVTYYLQDELPILTEQEVMASNLGFYLLINLNIIVLLVLGFLVVKNVVKLVLDRRRNILGSRLRSRLVTAFVGLSLIPTVLLFFTAKGILERVFQGWFSPQIEASVDGAVGVARYHYAEMEGQVERYSFYVASLIAETFPEPLRAFESSDDNKEATLLTRLLRDKRDEYGLIEIALVDRNGRHIAISKKSKGEAESLVIPPYQLGSVFRASMGGSLVGPEQSLEHEFLRGYVPIYFPNLQDDAEPSDRTAYGGASDYVLVLTHWIRPELNDVLASVIGSFDDYKELRSFRRPLASSYLLTLAIVMLLIVFAAIWVGFYLARSLSGPIQRLAEGTEQVAHGNLEYRIPEVADDELGVLVHSFNTMTEDLKRTTGELVQRRRYMETVLASVGVGVIAVDHRATITTCNVAAREILALEPDTSVIDRMLTAVLPEALAGRLHEMLESLYDSSEKVRTENVSHFESVQSKDLQVTLTKLVSEQGLVLGAVILIDDLTELVSAQRMAAWREVARRIAHEIKNPLTPIQLSAQRMQRKFGAAGALEKDEAAGEIITECTDTIVAQVETLRTLVNEFSEFARMPKAQPKPTNLNQLISETMLMYTEAHHGILFEKQLDDSLPSLRVDREQIGRVLVNLFDNAVAAIESAGEAQRAANDDIRHHANPGHVVVRSSYDAELECVSFSVSDNGVGVPDIDKQKLFEPYFSTKRGGTGLGLSIVSAIITDHRGFIRIRDNEPFGTRFVIELPLERGPSEAV